MGFVKFNPSALDTLAAEVLPKLLPVGEKVAAKAARDAPKRSGSGARSIHAVIAEGEIRIGWDRDHFYMLFAEVGTSKQNARPFLRPALDARYDI